MCLCYGIDFTQHWKWKSSNTTHVVSRFFFLNILQFTFWVQQVIIKKYKNILLSQIVTKKAFISDTFVFRLSL